MKNLINARLVSNNGDETSTYDCDLLRDDITVREFVETLRARGGGINRYGVDSECSSVFNENFCDIYLTYGMEWFSQDVARIHLDFLTEAARCEEKLGDESEMKQESLHDVLSKYGDKIMKRCQWNGGWGSGEYYIQIKHPHTITETVPNRKEVI